MKAIVIIMVCICSFGCAKATDVGSNNEILEKVGFDKLADFAENGSNAIDLFESLVRGEWRVDLEALKNRFSDIGTGVIATVRENAVSISLPIIMSILAQIMLSTKAGALNGIQLFCRVTVSGILIEKYRTVHAAAAALIDHILSFSEIITPIMVSVLSLTGATTTASVLSPVSSLGALGISYLMKNVGLKLIAVGVVIALVGNLSVNFRLNRLFKLIKGIIIWLTGILMAAFTGILSIQGLMGSSVDSAAMRSAQYTAESLIPIIGGNVSQSMDSLLASTALIKNSIGMTGLILLLGRCLEPVVKLITFCLSMKLCAAVIEPAADKCIVDTCAQFGDIAEMLMVICLGCMLLVLLLIGACLVVTANIAG